MDMVCEKNSAIKIFDFDNDPIEPLVVDGWVKANGTTLGADCGIGIAAQMAVLTSKEIKHGPIECLITVDEETGLTGAFALKPGFYQWLVLLNLDSEDEGEIFIGCAGGIDTLATFSLHSQCLCLRILLHLKFLFQVYWEDIQETIFTKTGVMPIKF